MSCSIAILNADLRRLCDDPSATAVAVQGTEILKLGSTGQVLALCDDATQVFDAKGGSVLPGFVESHMHLFMGAFANKALSLAGLTGTTKITQAIHDYAAAHPLDSLLVVQGFQYGTLDDGQNPDRQMLDAICPDQPLLIQSADIHNGWANTAALTRAGVLHGRELGPGSHIELGADGQATGFLVEPPAVAVIQALGAHGGRESLGMEAAEPEAVSNEQRAADMALLRGGMRHCAAQGITAIINMDGNFYQAGLLRDIERAGGLSCRVELPYHFVPGQPDDGYDGAERMREMLASDMLWCNRIKFFMDGVLDMGTGYRVRDYPDEPGQKGAPLHDPARFSELATEFDKRGFQIAVHAIGDGAVRVVLDGYEAARQANGPQGNRHRIEHIELHDRADRPRFADLDVIASFMPPHPPGCGEFPVEPLATIIGRDQWPDAYAWRSLKDAGAQICFSSDWPIAALPPLEGMHIAMTRQRWADDQKDERLNFDEVVEAYTAVGAYACRRETRFGRLAEGLAADIVILDRVLTEENAQHTQVTTTICNGAVTYQANLPPL